MKHCTRITTGMWTRIGYLIQNWGKLALSGRLKLSIFTISLVDQNGHKTLRRMAHGPSTCEPALSEKGPGFLAGRAGLLRLWPFPDHQIFCRPPHLVARGVIKCAAPSKVSGILFLSPGSLGP